jgi:hypothetical protein
MQPSNLRDAMRLCKEYARQFHRLTVPAIAELIDETEDTLYKWLSTGKMPATKIPSYEHVCGIDYVTQYLALRSHKLLIDIPTGRTAGAMDVAELQTVMAKGMSLLISHYNEGGDIDEVVASLSQIMGGVAYHRENVQRQPELALFDEGAI